MPDSSLRLSSITAATNGKLKDENEDVLAPFSFEHFRPYDIAGNCAPETKLTVARWLYIFTHRGTGFGDRIGSRVKITEISVSGMPNEPEKKEARVVAEIIVDEDMTNPQGVIHGGCSMYLVDILSTLPLSALDFEQGGAGNAGVSQAIHTVFHAPARMGDNLRIVSTSLSVGGRTMTCRCEIWDTTNHRLVVSATQVKMQSTRL
ncbi:hypothetical protein FIBSPDRAFT_788193 [Athelia psychrophila]|uniref:Thioesterase domain-containing protein n=1 Tax=Athelia psychrophila TaxID=1759441 RepID=A0A166K7N9_9AGAM|nr:hypothetical protein FIBSPDRAFT_788193 [Fibularhizoctonia sp. CBS 109695]